MMMAHKMIRYGSAVALLLAASAPAFAQQPAPAPVEASAAQQLASPPPLGNLDEIRKFCGNIDDQAADARYALQARQLTDLKTDVEERMRALEEKRREYEMWLKRRDEFVSKAQDSLVDIISKMKPEAAAAQMTLIGDEAAAALILKLNPRVSSIILNEMPPEKAAKLARVIVGSQRTTTAPQAVKDQRAAAQSGNTVQ
ncbi:MotE family protein [Brucella tritici]|jgi:flagellar motility protein MotE (MotC chaperone)|uniref:MotE family protein n=1 Tax=Brucella tritici TaxID=94626 RepID=A0A6L3YQV4_9HYPH|nr:MotE family protein [Brucella tritici]KAB2665387.1 MotE family protein [Brucella tritici]KAB2685664.1 MotE family protein [Brucella tritici]NKW10530.1 MotE family protein [Brucella tritici]